jgi:alpha-tubulin suppressor-like RCC1 family protein
MAWGATGGGLARNGQVGNGSEAGSTVPVAGNGLKGVIGISAGYEHDLALLSGGAVRAWGANEIGQLGTGSTSGPETCGGTFPCAKTPVTVSELSGVSAVSAGGSFSLALLSNGTVDAWGDNEDGELGDGTNTGPEICPAVAEYPCSTKPVAVSKLTKVSAISGGYSHALALLSSGKVMAWGENEYGELGNGTTTDSSVPVEVSGLSGVVAISAGFNDSLALLSNGTVKAWGENNRGQLGSGATTGPEKCGKEEASCSITPVTVSELSGVTAISAGYWNSIALLSGGKVKTWGSNVEGQLGIGNSTGPETCSAEKMPCSATPVAVSGLSGVTAVSASVDTEVLALLGNGTVMAWGNNDAGQLGDGTHKGPEECNVFFHCSTKPVAVEGLADAAGIAAGGESGLAMVSATNPPEYGRCIKVEKGAGRYENDGCTKEGGEKGFEWYPDVVKTKFTLKGGSSTLEAAGGLGLLVGCKSESGEGEYSGQKTVAGVVLKFHECVDALFNKCSTAGAAEGEVITNPLAGVLGIEKSSAEGAIKNKIAWSLSAVKGLFSEFSCKSIAVEVRGSLLGPVAANAMSLASSRNYQAAKGKQKPEGFEGEPKEVLETSLKGSAFEQAGLTLESEGVNEEKVEINSVV